MKNTINARLLVLTIQQRFERIKIKELHNKIQVNTTHVGAEDFKEFCNENHIYFNEITPNGFYLNF